MENIEPLPQKETILKYYRDYPTTKTSEKDLDRLIPLSVQALKFFIEKMNLEENQLSKLSFLEIGFGNGSSLFAASSLSLDSYGIDPDPSNRIILEALAQKRSVSLKCATGEISDGMKWGLKFNIIKASQIIEHTIDPLKFLRDTALLQNSGGHLIIDCPNNEALFWVIKNHLRKRWKRIEFYNSLKLREHLWGFTKKSFRLALKKSGYTILFLRDFPMGNPIFQPESVLWYPPISESLYRTIKEKNVYHLLKSGVRIFDSFSSLLFRRGMGLVALAKKE